jgi:hypothetical protein
MVCGYQGLFSLSVDIRDCFPGLWISGAVLLGCGYQGLFSWSVEIRGCFPDLWISGAVLLVCGYQRLFSSGKVWFMKVTTGHDKVRMNESVFSLLHTPSWITKNVLFFTGAYAG